MVVIKLISTLVWGRLFLHSLCKSPFSEWHKKMRTNKYKATTNTHSSSSLQAKGRSGSETLSLQRSLNNLEKHNFFSYGVSGGWMKFFSLFQPTSITQIIIFRNNLWHETSLREIKLLPMNKNKFQPKVNHFSINFSHRDRCL